MYHCKFKLSEVTVSLSSFFFYVLFDDCFFPVFFILVFVLFQLMESSNILERYLARLCRCLLETQTAGVEL